MAWLLEQSSVSGDLAIKVDLGITLAAFGCSICTWWLLACDLFITSGYLLRIFVKNWVLYIWQTSQKPFPANFLYIKQTKLLAYSQVVGAIRSTTSVRLLSYLGTVCSARCCFLSRNAIVEYTKAILKCLLSFFWKTGLWITTYYIFFISTELFKLANRILIFG